MQLSALVQPASRSWALAVALGLALVTAYFLAASAGILLTRETDNVAALWPPNAILLAALLRSEKRAWPGMLLGCMTANFIANLLFGDSSLVAAGFAVCNMLEVLTATMLLQRFQPGCDLGTSRQALAFFLHAGVLAPLVGASFGAALIASAYGSSYGAVWQVWWIADAMGFLIVTPLLLTINRQTLLRLAEKQGSEAVALFSTVILVTVMVFTQTRFPLLYTVVPLLLWAAFRLQVFGAALAGVLVSAIAISFSVYGQGPIADVTVGSATDTVLFLQLFLSVAVLMPLMAAVLLAEQNQTGVSLREEKERALVTLHSIGDAVLTTDAAGIVTYLNPVAEVLTGWRTEDASGQPVERVFRAINEETRELEPSPVIECLSTGEATKLDGLGVLIARSGEESSIEDSCTPIRDGEGRTVGVVLVFRNVTESRRLTQELNHQATHDALTGLVNRAEFERRLERVLKSARESSGEHALCYLDLDQFKVVNDTCGHVAGDELLRQLTNLFGELVRKGDTLARLGGDEFGILLEHCTIGQAQRLADSVREAVAEYRFHWSGSRFGVGVSIGLVPITAASGGIANVFSAADAACYAAKDGGRNRTHLYQEDDAAIARQHGQMGWVTKIACALEENSFQLQWQPIVPITRHGAVHPSPGNTGHYELLLRLENENGTIACPGEFLPAAERFGFASKIDQWVITTVLNWLARQPEHLQQLELCAINLSAYSLTDSGFLDFVKCKFKSSGVPASKICFEVTETTAISNLARARAFISSLKALGCRFALDDFGSGVSSFAYLKSLPVDFLKIDGMFVKDIAHDPVDFAMVKSINEIGQMMGKQTIAECAENAEVMEVLREIGVDFAQGYYHARPRPIHEMLDNVYPLRAPGVG